MKALSLRWKALSLWQPWASLMASGAKRIETRSWPPHGLRTGELVALHAAKRWTAEERYTAQQEPFLTALRDAERRGLWDFDTPPLGMVIAIARFHHAAETLAADTSPLTGLDYEGMSDEEYTFGNYGDGRWAWVFDAVRPIKPIPLAGKQGLFAWQSATADITPLEPRNELDWSAIERAWKKRQEAAQREKAAWDTLLKAHTPEEEAAAWAAIWAAIDALKEESE